MLTPKTPVKNGRMSTFLAPIKRLFSTPEKPKSYTFDFITKNKGSISSSTISPGIIKCSFTSKATGRTAFAFGPTLGEAYANMISKFNLKYAN